MEQTNGQTVPKYMQIAADLACKIVDRTYRAGDKIYARSAIGSQYSVSSETARRAVCVLADWDIVEVEKTAASSLNLWTTREISSSSKGRASLSTT